MGGCCCHNDDTKDEDGEEKCIIVGNEERDLPPKKEYGSLSTMEDKHELYYEEPPESGKDNRQISSRDEASGTQLKEEAFEEHSPSNNVYVSQSGLSLQETAAESEPADKEAVNNNVSAAEVTDDMSQGDVDREIDELVAAAMATKVIYPPSTGQEESSLSQQPVSHHRASAAPAQDPPSDQESGSDSEFPTKRASLMKKTQMSLKRAKARATSMVSMHSRNSGEQTEKKHISLQKNLSSPDRKAPSWDERSREKDYKKSLYAKKESRDEARTSYSKTEMKVGKRKKGFEPGEKMKSQYGKDRAAQFEVERVVRDKMASKRAANDPRKAALERGERLGQLDDTIEEMRDHSSSFAQVARQLRDEQRGRTSTFPW